MSGGAAGTSSAAGRRLSFFCPMSLLLLLLPLPRSFFVAPPKAGIGPGRLLQHRRFDGVADRSRQRQIREGRRRHRSNVPPFAAGVATLFIVVERRVLVRPTTRLVAVAADVREIADGNIILVCCLKKGFLLFYMQCLRDS